MKALDGPCVALMSFGIGRMLEIVHADLEAHVPGIITIIFFDLDVHAIEHAKQARSRFHFLQERVKINEVLGRVEIKIKFQILVYLDKFIRCNVK